MAPTTEHSLVSRYKRMMLTPRTSCDYYDDGDGNCDSYSSWNSWGRWVALVVIVVAFLFIALTFSCYNNRRRRRMGAPPMYGTGWMPAPKYNQQQNGYYGGPAPPYSAQPMGNQATGTTFNSNDGYYGHHGQGNGGIELQQPQNVYTHPQREVYEPPMGPPPGKGDGIIR
ncbi:Protein RCR2 [Lachnellula subtilissima]|uniref:Protein RCR2 n=1 Tax=Lachnellula subtilissima TaxID=602034 RepID=A0A8H8RPN4_9HELO|nr:Protein RCR2 [Lachnellula subtilissima]